MTQEDYLHLRIYNAKNPDCARCHANSTRFNIIPRAGSGGNNEHWLKLGLGLGLGLGIPLFLALVGLLVFLFVRRRKSGTGSSAGTGEELMGYRQERRGVEHVGGDDMRKSYEPDARDGINDKVEVDGHGVVEMAHERDVAEMPAQRERVELEGDMEHRHDSVR